MASQWLCENRLTEESPKLTGSFCLLTWDVFGKTEIPVCHDSEAMKCADCGQEILQVHPELCPYCKSKNLISEEDTSKLSQEAQQMAKAGKYEKAALNFEKLEMWKEAKDCRLQAKKKHKGQANPEMGKIGAVTIICPHCGATQTANLKSPEETCNRCGTTYLIPKEALSLELFEK